MEKIKKILTIYLTLFIALTNFSVVFADEEEIENNKEETQEIEQEQEQQEIIVNYENQEQLNNIENEINEINDNLNEFIPMLLSNFNLENYGRYFNFNRLSPFALTFYYENFNNISAMRIYGNDGENYEIAYFTNENYSSVLNNNFYNLTGHVYRFRYNDTSLQNQTNLGTQTYRYFYLNNSDNYNQGFIKAITNDENEHIIYPYKLNIINNGLGIITNSINIEPYISTNIYYKGQQITLTYDNSNDDFNGWYKNGVYVSNNLNYTFIIDTDTTIEINKYIEPIDTNNYSTILICIFICLLFITFKSLIWGV